MDEVLLSRFGNDRLLEPLDAREEPPGAEVAEERVLLPGPSSSTAVAPAERQDPRIGAQVGEHYRLERLCGRGAMSQVYRAHHDGIDRPFAVKILREGYRDRPEVLEQFVQEAQRVAQLAHPNIVSVTEHGRTLEDFPFFAMEYVDGFSVRQLLYQGGALSVERALQIVVEVVSALERAHQGAIVHRSLKPSNVMVVAQGEGAGGAKILDFGLSETFEIDGVVASPHYLAPEQAQGKPAVLGSDVYAVGELVYEMISGVPTWEGETAREVIERKLTQDPRALDQVVPEVSPELSRLVMNVLARNPEARPSMKNLGVELAACLQALRRPAASDSLAASQPSGRLAAALKASGPGRLITALVKRRGSERAFPALLVVVGVVMGSILVGRSSPPVQLRGPQILVESMAGTPGGEASRERSRPGPFWEPTSLVQVDGDGRRSEPLATSDHISAVPGSSPPRQLVLVKPIRELAQAEPAVMTGDAAQGLVTEAVEAFARRDYGLALSRAQDALAVDAQCFDAHMVLARVHFLLERFRAAAHHFGVAVSLRPMDQAARRGLAASELRAMN